MPSRSGTRARRCPAHRSQRTQDSSPVGRRCSRPDSGRFRRCLACRDQDKRPPHRNPAAHWSWCTEAHSLQADHNIGSCCRLGSRHSSRCGRRSTQPRHQAVHMYRLNCSNPLFRHHIAQPPHSRLDTARRAAHPMARCTGRRLPLQPCSRSLPRLDR